MSWLKIDDGFFEHEKIENLSDAAFRLHVGGLCLCARLLTDGRVTENNLRKIAAAGRIAAPRRRVQELVDARLWSALPSGGWKIKDYLEYNPSSVKVKEDRARNAERQARFQARKRQVIHRDIHRNNGVSNTAPSRTPLNTKNYNTNTPLATEEELAKIAQIDALRNQIGRSI